MAPPPTSALLSPQQLYHLIPHIPTILAWLRHEDATSAGDLFFTPSYSDEVERTLREFINTLNFNGELTNVQLRYIFFCHDKVIWASAVRKILFESEPRMVPTEIGNALTEKLNDMRNAESSDEAAKIVGAVLDQLPRNVFLALGELCAFFRDTCSGSSEMAGIMGPMLFCPRIAGGSAAAQAATAIMDMLIDEAEAVFGRMAGYNKSDAMGVRKPPPALKQRAAQAQQTAPGDSAGSYAAPSPMPPLPPRGFSDTYPAVVDAPVELTMPALSKNVEPAKQSKDQKRRDQLRAFFELRLTGLKYAEIVDDIFDNHDFEDIARGVFERYHVLPPGWQHDLVECRNNPGSASKLAWFDEQKINANKQRVQNGEVIPPSKPLVAGNLGKVDMIINEIIDTEEAFRDSMHELEHNYISAVREIALGKKGKQAAEELGLSSVDVERIFGWRVVEIVKVSNVFLKRLEVVNLCRDEVKSPLGRRGLVAQAFLAIVGDLHVYAPYVSAHRSSLQTLEKALAAIQAKTDGAAAKKGGGLFGAFKDKNSSQEKDTSMSFVKLWETVSQGIPRLRGQSIQSLIIMPVQRVPRYKLLLGECIKSTEADHPAYGMLTEVLELINHEAKQINEALRQHEKLEKFFGQEEIASPAISEKDATGKIRQNYVEA